MEQIPPPHTGLLRVWKAFFYSLKGFRAAWRHEAAFRQESLLALALLPLLWWMNLPLASKMILLVTLVLVLITELLNSGLEAVVDKASPEFHELAGRAKDLGSAAVLTSLVLLVVTWGWGLAVSLGML